MTQTYRFNQLPAHKLLAYVVEALGAATHQDPSFTAPWHLCWLNNAGHPVIGLLPKVAWMMQPSTAHAAATTPCLSLEQALASAAMQLTTTIRRNGEANSQQRCASYQDWANILIAYANSNANLEGQPHAADVYQHGFMGFIGYDISAQHISPHAKLSISKQPAAFMGHYDIYLTQNSDSSWQLHTQSDTDVGIIARVKRQLHAIDQTLQQTLNLSANEQGCDLSTASLSQSPPTPALTLQAQWDYKAYAAAFDNTMNYLYKGDSYQINLTQKWDCQFNYQQLAAAQPCNAPPRLLCYLPQLYHNTQAPYAGYLQLHYTIDVAVDVAVAVAVNSDFHTADTHNGHPNKETFELVSCSPELFMLFSKDRQGQHQISTKPIKGTRPRGATPSSDAALKDELQHSDKDRAENVMIVDLLRNDLGKYAKTGSVQVPKLFAIESFSNVHHMVSTVTATIKDEVHPLTVLFDSLPAGSITGTPKKRAVEIISELEVDARGAYCGTLGFMNFDGTGQWNVLIRTLQGTSNNDGLNVNLWAGGGITVGSKCEAEYQECRDKVGNLLAVLAKSAGHTLATSTST